MSQSMSEMDVYLGLLSMCLSSKESEKKMLSVLRLLVRNSKGDVSSKEALYRGMSKNLLASKSFILSYRRKSH